MNDAGLFCGDAVIAAMGPPFAKMSFEVMYCSPSSYMTEKKLDQCKLGLPGNTEISFSS